MKFRKQITICLAVITVLAGYSCKKETQEDGPVDVQFQVPEKLEIENDAATVKFRIQFAKAPVKDDKIIFEDQDAASYTCPVVSVGSQFFEASAVELWLKGASDGIHQVYFQRGSSPKKLMGETKLVIIYPSEGVEVKPAAGSTVYGRVSCEGSGVEGVVVSDGAEVVKTDKDGIYQMASAKHHKYVFISIPSGYEVPREGILPTFHKQLTKASNVAERVDFTLKSVGSQDEHTMLMFGDIHLARRTNDRNQFSSFVNDVNSYLNTNSGKKIYAMTLGDMTWDLYWITNNYSYDEYLQDANQIKGLGIFHTIGNHDHSMYYMGDFDTVKEYKEKIAPTYYSFNIGKVHYIVLDDVECTNSTSSTDSNGKACYVRTYNAKLVADQIEWLKKDLATVPTTTPLVVTMHIQMQYSDASTSLSGLSNFKSILKPFPEVHVFTAHTHTIFNHDHLSTDHYYEHNAGAICGTWWWTGQETPGIHIGQDGSPGGYTVMTVSGTNFKWQYKGTGKALSHQFRSYDRNSIHLSNDKWIPNADDSHAKLFKPGIWGTESTANEVYVNVWNYDPEWTVSISESGKELSVTKVSGIKDPLHLISYTAHRLNKNTSIGFETNTNYHTFKATATSPNSTLEIKVTDRFGNVYTESMSRPKAFSIDSYK